MIDDPINRAISPQHILIGDSIQSVRLYARVRSPAGKAGFICYIIPDRVDTPRAILRPTAAADALAILPALKRRRRGRLFRRLCRFRFFDLLQDLPAQPCDEQLHYLLVRRGRAAGFGRGAASPTLCSMSFIMSVSI